MSEPYVPETLAPTGRWNTSRAVLTVLAVAVAIRLLALLTLSLIITNDGVDYVWAGLRVWEDGTLLVNPERAPGYSFLLAGVFSLLGASANAILFLQHTLGCIACVMIAWVGCRMAGPRWGWIPGLLLALDPWLLMFESYALSETTAVFLVLSAASIVLVAAYPRQTVRPRATTTIVSGVGLGLALGAACLTRPALEAMVPFFVLGWLVANRGGWRVLLLRAVVVACGFALVVGPWIAYNQRRGVTQVAGGLAAQQWGSLAQFDLIDWSYPVDNEVRDEYQRRFGDLRPDSYELLKYLHDIGAFDRRAGQFRRWSRYSVLHNFRPYMAIWFQALAWQLNWIPDARLVDLDQLNWYVGRLGQDGSGLQFDSERVHRLLADFDSRGRGGPLRWFMTWWAAHRIPGIPQIPLFALAILTILVAALRRNWALALVLAGTVVFLLAHVTLLKSPARYALPAWTAWYLTVAALPALIWRNRPAAHSADGNAPSSHSQQ